jgi:hypothetical protein
MVKKIYDGDNAELMAITPADKVIPCRVDVTRPEDGFSGWGSEGEKSGKLR